MFPLDMRIPVILTDEPGGEDDALLIEGVSFQLAQDHPAGCLCCGARNPAGRALAALLQARAKGQVPFFKRVIARTSTQAGRGMVEAALAGDPVASACFRQGLLS